MAALSALVWLFSVGVLVIGIVCLVVKKVRVGLLMIGSSFLIWFVSIGMAMSASPSTASSAPSGSAPTTTRAASTDANCRHELRCWGEKHLIDASVSCRRNVERLAKNDFQWTDSGFFDQKFSRYRWKSETDGTVTYVGDKIKFQNGFGAWIRSIYECDFDPNGGRVLDVRATPGQLR